MQPKNTWVVVVDGGRARFYLARAGERSMLEALDHVMVANRLPSHERWSDRAGVGRQSASHSVHAKQAPTDPHDREKVLLARRAAKVIERGRTDGMFDALILVASPTLLGHLRKAMSSQALGMVTQTYDKDLAGLSESGLKQRLVELVAHGT